MSASTSGVVVRLSDQDDNTAFSTSLTDQLNKLFSGHIKNVNLNDDNIISLPNGDSLDISQIMDYYELWKMNKLVMKQLVVARICALVLGTQPVAELQESVKKDGFLSEVSVKAIQELFETAKANSSTLDTDTQQELNEASRAYNNMMTMVGMPVRPSNDPLTFNEYLRIIKRLPMTYEVEFKGDNEGVFEYTMSPYRGDAIGISDFSACKDASDADIPALIRDRQVDSECTLYFLSDFEGRYHVMIEFLLKNGIIEIREHAASGETYITWTNPKVLVFQCGDAIDDRRWAAPEVPPDSGIFVEKHPDDLGRDLDAWFVFDYLRRISRGNFINIFGNHDIWNMQGTSDKYNITVLYPDAKYVTADGAKYSRTEFVKRFVFPFYSMTFVYVLRIINGPKIIASHAGVHPDHLNDLKQFIANVHVHEDIALIVDPKMPIAAPDAFGYKVLNESKGVTMTRIFNEMCSVGSVIKDELLNQFNAVSESYVQVLGHNKDIVNKVSIREVVPGNKCVDSWTWDGAKPKFHVACMVDALNNEKSPKNVQALKYSSNKFEKITTDCDYTDDWYRKFRKIISDNLYKLVKGEKAKDDAPPASA